MIYCSLVFFRKVKLSILIHFYSANNINLNLYGGMHGKKRTLFTKNTPLLRFRNGKSDYRNPALRQIHSDATDYYRKEDIRYMLVKPTKAKLILSFKKEKKSSTCKLPIY